MPSVMGVASFMLFKTSRMTTLTLVKLRLRVLETTSRAAVAKRCGRRVAELALVLERAGRHFPLMSRAGPDEGGMTVRPGNLEGVNGRNVRQRPGQVDGSVHALEQEDPLKEGLQGHQGGIGTNRQLLGRRPLGLEVVMATPDEEDRDRKQRKHPEGEIRIEVKSVGSFE